jgi:TonB family protein
MAAMSLLAACSSHTSKERATVASYTPTRSCNHDAAVLRQAQPEWPALARRVHEAQVTVGVSVAASGQLTFARIVQSSGDPALDGSALDAARTSTYSPARRRCRPFAGTYLFRVTFSSND